MFILYTLDRLLVINRFFLDIRQEGDATTPTDLMATSGLDQIYLNWNPFDPAVLEGRVESNISSEIAQMNIEEHVQYRNDKIENSKVDNPNVWQGKTLEATPRSCGNFRFTTAS